MCPKTRSYSLGLSRARNVSGEETELKENRAYSWLQLRPLLRGRIWDSGEDARLLDAGTVVGGIKKEEMEKGIIEDAQDRERARVSVGEKRGLVGQNW